MRKWFVARAWGYVLGFAVLSNISVGAAGLDPAFNQELLGPERAAGAIVWNHGRSINVEDSESPTPPIFACYAIRGGMCSASTVRVMATRCPQVRTGWSTTSVS
jgi:hypothetical protein